MSITTKYIVDSALIDTMGEFFLAVAVVFKEYDIKLSTQHQHAWNALSDKLEEELARCRTIDSEW